MRRSAAGAACLATVALVGCGGSNSYKNEPRPPQTLVITASILPDKVSISPARFGAGPISLVVANQTDASQQLSIVRRINGQEQQTPEQTGPINPHDTASLQADVEQGEYLLRVEGEAIRPARMTVGAMRPSAQNKLLQP